MVNTRHEDLTTPVVTRGDELPVVKLGASPFLTKPRSLLTTTPDAEGTARDERSWRANTKPRLSLNLNTYVVVYVPLPALIDVEVVL